MKIILPLLLLVPVLLAAEDEKLAELVTLDGKTYQGVTIRKVEPDGLSILHAAGTAKVPFEKLPEELQEKYGYDATAAAEHRKQAAEAQRKQDAAERAAGEKRKKEAAKAAMAEADKGFAEKVEKAAKMMRVGAFKNTRLGLAGDIYVGALTTERVRSTLGSTTGHKPVWEFRGLGIQGIIAGTKDATVETEAGSPVILWEGKAWRIGMIEYLGTKGMMMTVPLFTASEKEAAAFYKKNGFGPASERISYRMP